MAQHSSTTTQTRGGQYAKLVAKKIEDLRPRLLDLTARNPLIAMSFQARSTSHVRVVDEVPEFLFFRLINGDRSFFSPLPPFDEDSKDEQAPAFVEAYALAYRRDEIFTDQLGKLDPEDPSYVDLVRRLERDLKDRLRAELKMPPRITRKDESVAQHAKNNGIAPSYDLPSPDGRNVDGRHDDDKIQTLLLPQDLERKLNAIISKARTVEQETGIGVLRAAIGFLEWKDPARSDDRNYLSPLIMLPVSITSRRTSEGPVYSVESAGEDAELNLSLKEKFRREFGIELPEYDGGSVEGYFETIEATTHRKLPWRVRRQMVFGVFPAARMSMYADLDTSDTDFASNKTLEDILVGSDRPTDGSLAEEYDADDPVNEIKVPFTVKKADSSQFSVLVDLANGKNLAVEGPPGTGKSDTIVNAIAAAMAAGKKVLFVAEKSAALEVVRNRIEEVGLGEFVLPLLAGRSTRDEFMSSVRDRLELRPQPPRNLQDQVGRFSSARNKLAEYVRVLASEWANTGDTVHTWLGSATATAEALGSISTAVALDHRLPDTTFTIPEIKSLGGEATRLGQLLADAEITPSFWHDARTGDASPFAVDRILELARTSADAFAEVAEAQKGLSSYSLEGYGTAESHDDLIDVLYAIGEHIDLREAGDHALLICTDESALLEEFLGSCQTCQELHRALSEILADPLKDAAQKILEELAELCASSGIKTLDVAALARQRDELESSLASVAAVDRKLQSFVLHCPQAKKWTLEDMVRLKQLLSSTKANILRMRSPALSDAVVVSTLADLSSRGGALQLRKSQLANDFRLGHITIPEVAAIQSRLNNASAFSFLSRSYREAKTRYRDISRRSKFDRSLAVSDLDRVQSFLDDAATFTERARNSGVFGVGFNGVETDFSEFLEVATYYQSVDEQFQRLDQREIRQFLKSGDLDVLLETPVLPDFDGSWTVEDVTRLHQQRKEEFDTINAALASLRPLVRALRNPAEVKVGHLPTFAEQASRFAVLRTELEDSASVSSILGGLFRGWHTPVDEVEPYLHANSLITDASAMAGGLRAACQAGRLSDLRDLATEISELFSAANEGFDAVADAASGDFTDQIAGETPARIAALLRKAASDEPGLRRSLEIAARLDLLAEAGVVSTVERLIDSGAEADGLGPILESLLFRAAAERIYAHHGRGISGYSGENLEELRRALKNADDEIRLLSRKALRADLIGKARPPFGISKGRVGDLTQMGLLQHLIDRRRIRQSVREITRRSAGALLELKPCWIMSPLAVAQYIPKGTAEFDLCIIDEASQMPPEDAIGALYRATQTMVVGDTRQLPPTNFFRQILDDPEDDDDADPVMDESVLEMANATFRPKRMLRWHYRSRNSSLIRFSNRIMYDDNLVVFPSPNEDDKSSGVSLVETKGLYKAGLNDIEAHIVVEHVLEFMRTSPGKSLGVVAINKAQADHIRELLDYQIARSSFAFGYVESWKEREGGLNPFFVKNLENVQGDERDVIFISTVYGPPTPGKKALQRFGPINGAGGQRRLNVLFSRARDQIVTFSSMTSADITAEQRTNPGAWMLKRWLEYSAGAPLEVSDNGVHSAFDSPLENYVAEQLRSMGCLVDCQVGVAGYAIDLGVRHPDWPYGYVLGVECDGATYHSSKSARDRDRHRQEVLENLGWHLHRVWSTDWFSNPRLESERLRSIVIDRLASLKENSKRTPAVKQKEQIVAPLKPDPVVSDTDVWTDKRLQPEQQDLPFRDHDSASAQPDPKRPDRHPPAAKFGVQFGDTVRIRYLDKPGDIFQFRIVSGPSAPERGLVNSSAPLAKSVMGCEVDDEFEVLFGSRIRKAIVEKLEKATT